MAALSDIPIDHLLCMQLFSADSDDVIPQTNTQPNPDDFGDIKPLVSNLCPRVNDVLTQQILNVPWKWDNGSEITIKFIEPGTTRVRQSIQKFAAKWLDYANLKFNWVDNGNADIRISFSAKGSWSYVGTRCKQIAQNQATMNFGWFKDTTTDLEFERTTVHEFGHAIGCVHEQFNPDFPFHWNVQAVKAYFMGPPNDWSEATVKQNFNDFVQADPKSNEHTKWDPNSIMHYAIKKEFTTDAKSDFGGSSTLSALDKSFIAQMYPGKK